MSVLKTATWSWFGDWNRRFRRLLKFLKGVLRGAFDLLVRMNQPKTNLRNLRLLFLPYTASFYIFPGYEGADAAL